MHILVVSDLHGDLDSARRACDRLAPDLILACGDWGDPAEVNESKIAEILTVAPVYTTFGNHDPIELLDSLRNRDNSPVLLAQGESRVIHGLRLAAIGGIWAKSHTKSYYVTDADVVEIAGRIAKAGPIDILLTHACPIGLADLTPSGRHGGQRCFLDANKTIMPRLHLCGHLHVPQEHTLKDGRRILNVGATPEGSVVVIEFEPDEGKLLAILEKIPSP